MGMTIDEAIKIVRTMHYPTNGDNEKERDTAIILLLDTAKKYQKIQEIVKRWVDVDLKESPSIADTNTIEEILEMLEDGKID